MVKKNIKFIPTRHVEAHPHSRHPEERSDVRVSGQVGAVFGSQGPHGDKAPSGRRESGESGESGRSMVEMLGTLAIMGVLSVGAVAGYRYAIDKFNANTILDGISKRAVTASQQRLVGQSINLNEYGVDEIQGYTVTHTNDVDGDTAFFSLSVTGVPKGICDKVIQDKLRTATEVWLNTNTDVTDGGTCDDNENGNTIEFVFANTLDPNALPTEPVCNPACTTEQECLTIAGEKKCVSSCPSGTTRDDETGKCTDDKCTDYTNCDEGYFCNFDSACATTGTCKAISPIIAKTGTLTVSGVEYNAVCSAAGSSNLNSFYKAEDWCLAMGGRLLTSDETCARTENTYGDCPSNDSASTLRTQIHSFCNMGFGSDWLWVYRAGNNRNSCYMFSVGVRSDDSGVATYESGGKSDRRALCLLP